MAVKTITIDLEAYGLLARLKRDGRSFSEVIKAHFRVTPSAGAFKALVRSGRGMSEEALDAVDAVVRQRAGDPVRFPEL